MSKYVLKFEKLIAEILPPQKRKLIRINLLYRLMAWLRKIWSEFSTHRQLIDDQIKTTQHVIVVESHLNHKFGLGITIDVHEVQFVEEFIADDDDTDIGFLIVDDDEPIGGSFISDQNDLSNGFNFTVNVPAALGADPDKMTAIIDRFKVPGSTYQIVGYY